MELLALERLHFIMSKNDSMGSFAEKPRKEPPSISYVIV
jgi:hypothetical protein